MIELNKVHNMDCLEGLRQLPDASVDVIITDPPWPNGRGLFEDTILDGYAALYLSCKKAQKVIFFWGNVGVPVPPAGWFEIARHIWHKPNGQSATYYENIIVWSKENKPSVSKVWRIPIINYETLPEWLPHPTQKPIKLMRELVSCSSKEGQLVVDPFMGSGSTAKACKELNRNFIGFEINPAYCDLANERLKQEVLLGTLN
jgi:site-specific DNA-methyltransferase (adenine-specific)